MTSKMHNRAVLMVLMLFIIAIASTRLKADSGSCGGVTVTVPFTDVMGEFFFCQIAEAYFSGLSNGTDPTHFSPAANVPREQMAAFITHAMDQSLRRGSPRAALNQFWTSQGGNSLGLTSLPAGAGPRLLKSDGADIWIANSGNATVSRVRASDGSKIGADWTMATGAHGVLLALGKVFVCGTGLPGHLYTIDPTLAPGSVAPGVDIGNAIDIAFDGQKVWTSNQSGSVSIVTLPSTVNTVSTGFTNLQGIVFDGSNMWVTDMIAGGPVGKLYKLNSAGGIVQSVDVDSEPELPAFDGTNIWVPNRGSNSITIVRAATGDKLATLTGNGLHGPFSAAFDGERVLVTNVDGSSVSLWRASDLAPIGTFLTGSSPTYGACSDRINFWITLGSISKLARF